MTRNIKSDMLITNIAITKFKNVILKNRIIFSISEFWGPNQVFGVQTRFLTLLSHRLVSRRSRKASFRCDLLSSIRIWTNKDHRKCSAIYNSEIRLGSAWSPFFLVIVIHWTPLNSSETVTDRCSFSCSIQICHWIDK